MKMKKRINKGLLVWWLIHVLCLGLLTGCGNSGNALAGQSMAGSEGQQTPGSNPDGQTVEEMEVHFIDVGQGDATLVKCGGQALLIDTGEADKGTAVQNYLKKQGVERLDYLILTHPDADHIGAAPVILTKFEVGQVFMSNFEKDNSTYRKLIQALDDKQQKPLIPEVGSTVTLGSSICTFLAPLEEYNDPNNSSVAILLQNGDNRFLFTGDAQEEAETDILSSGQDIHADVYKAGHHGSRTSSGEAFLDAVEPASVVISCGEDNSYGHPHAATMNQLRVRGIQVYRTDEQGSIIALSDGSVITWNTAPSESWKAGEPVGASPAVGAAAVTDQGQKDGGTGTSEQKVYADNHNGSGNTDITYVLNTKTMKFHLAGCGSLPTANRKDTDMSRDEITVQGYEPCSICKP